jgi:hypothetical protein
MCVGGECTIDPNAGTGGSGSGNGGSLNGSGGGLIGGADGSGASAGSTGSGNGRGGREESATGCGCRLAPPVSRYGWLIAGLSTALWWFRLRRPA